MELLLCQWTQQTGRDPGHHGVGGNVLGDNGAGGHNGAVTDGDPREHRGVGADPDPITDDDGSRMEPVAPGGRGVVVQGGQDYIVADEDAVADGNAPLVLEPTAGVEKDLFPKGDVLPAVGGKGGNKVKLSSTGLPMSWENRARISSGGWYPVFSMPVMARASWLSWCMN